MCIDKVPEVAKTKVSKPKRYSLFKLRLDHAHLKRLIQTHPHVSTSRCGKICKTPPKCICNERRWNYYSHCSIVAAAGAMSWRCCVSLLKRKYFGHPKEDTTRNLWLSCIYNTVPEQFTCALCIAFYGGLFPEPGRVAYNAGLHKACFYKVGQFQLCKDSLALLTHSL